MQGVGRTNSSEEVLRKEERAKGFASQIWYVGKGMEGRMPNKFQVKLREGLSPCSASQDRECSIKSDAEFIQKTCQGKQEGGRGKKRKWYTLIDKVYDKRNLRKAWVKVKENGGSPGVDGTTIEKFEENLEENLQNLRNELAAKTYVSQSLRRVAIPKPNGKQRILGIPTVRDRVVHQAIAQIIYPIFHPWFERCYGYVEGRSAADAIWFIRMLIEQGYVYAVEADIKGCFDNIEHRKLLRTLNVEIADGSLLRLIQAILRSGAMNCDVFLEELIGTPQGSPLSPLLANIYLVALDKGFDKRKVIVRYADDFVILTRTKEEAEEALKQAEEILGGVKLSLNLEKTRISHISEGWEFLSFRIKKRYAVPTWKSIKKFKAEVRSLTMRHATWKTDEMIRQLNRYVVGWSNYFRIGNVKTLFWKLGQYIIIRVRKYITKKPWLTDLHRKIPFETLYRLGLVLPSNLLKTSTGWKSRMP